MLVVFLVTFVTTPESKLNWWLEVGPGVIGMVALAATFKRFPMSRLIYVCVFVHVLILVYGGFYTYAKAPLGEWAKEAFGWHRNNYDKIGHFAQGFVPWLVAREILLRGGYVTGRRMAGFRVFASPVLDSRLSCTGSSRALRAFSCRR